MNKSVTDFLNQSKNVLFLTTDNKTYFFLGLLKKNYKATKLQRD